MKARNFRYVRPATLQDAYRILSDPDAVPVAGGQSLLAGLNMRLSSPKVLVDIGNLKELTGQTVTDGVVRLGALTRHREVLGSELVRKHLPLLSLALPYVGHVAIRNRGTLGGSLAYADPAAELPACTVALDATLVLGSTGGEREVKAEDFFKGLFETDLKTGELIMAVKFPAVPPGTSVGFAELSRRRGDFAIAGVAAVAAIRDDQIASARIVYLGCVDRAKVARSVSASVIGHPARFTDHSAFEDSVRQDLSPDDMPGLRADTRIHMATVLTRRVLNTLSEKAAA
jgi:carbon-monoxide dehydrogenase medium subunit